jgi:hypothetical protein
VGQTLEFAAAARTPENRLNGISRAKYAKHITQVAMAVLGLSHTYNTKGGLIHREESSSADRLSSW